MLRIFISPLTQQYDGEITSGHVLKDMLYYCSFAGDEECPADTWSWVFEEHYYNCYTFNPAAVTDREMQDSTGPDGGLHVIIDVEERLYQDTVDQAGLRVMVHPPHEVPLIQAKSFAVSVGVSTNIAMRKKNTIRAPSPYSACQSFDQEGNEEMSFFAARYSYSQGACQISCFQYEAIRDRGCCIEATPCNELNKTSVLGLEMPSNLTYCSGSNMGVMTFSSDCSEGCPPSCYETKYDGTVSFLAWPPSGSLQEEDLKTYLNQTMDLSTMSATEQASEVKANFLELKVFYETLDVEVYESSPKYDGNSLFSSFGGVLGLCVGFSALTAVELLELAADLCCYCVSFFRLKRRQ